jgi:hypothetical protein
MSGIAYFTKLPKAALGGLRQAAVTQVSGSVGTFDSYAEYLNRYGQSVSEYQGAGIVFATLLIYLQQEKNIDLMKSDYDELARALTKTRQSAHFIFTEAHKVSLLNELNPQLLTGTELGEFCNKFNETSDPHAGAAMLDGIIALQICMTSIDGDSVVVMSIS